MARNNYAQRNRNAQGRTGRAGTAYYTEGNTVRKVQGAPQEFERERHERRRQRAHEQRRLRRAARAELSIDLPFLLLLSIAVAATLVICCNYLRLNASIDAHMDRIESLETELENIKTENDALEQSIDTSVDLNEVYRIAVNELGMIHAGKDNVISYDKTESEYVRQNENIPKN